MIETSEIDRIKHQVAIADVLADRGIHPDHRSGDELLYCSPFRTDANPSFSVNVRENVFRDLVVKEYRGDVIRLVSLLDGVGFATAVNTLQDFGGKPDRPPSFLLSGSLCSATTPHSKDIIRDVKLLSNPSLLRYIESRGIGIGIARTYLREVHYTNGDRYLYAVGFQNDRDGYFLRNGVGCKRNIGPSGMTTLAGTRPGGQTANVFEGVFDFLSALEYFGQCVPTFPTYILNSVSNLSSFIEIAGQYARINTYFDHDKAGQDAFAVLQAQNLPVFDRSGLYQAHKDLNDYLVSAKKPTYQ